MELHERINMIGPWLRRKLGGKVVKVGLDLNLGCPQQPGGGRCIYCSPMAASQGQGGLDIASQLECAGSRAGKKLAYFQAHSSTNAPASVLAPWFWQAASHPQIFGVIISTRPDCLDDEHWQLLAELKERGRLCWLELGLQSSHDYTLQLISRGHDVACFRQAASRAASLNIPVVAHVILGLPGEDINHTSHTARYLAEQKIWGVKLHSLMVLQHTRLAQMWREGNFVPWELDQWVEGTAQFLAWLPPATTIHRLSADPGRNETCLAPSWIGKKQQALQALLCYMKERNLQQGSFC